MAPAKGGVPASVQDRADVVGTAGKRGIARCLRIVKAMGLRRLPVSLRAAAVLLCRLPRGPGDATQRDCSQARQPPQAVMSSAPSSP